MDMTLKEEWILKLKSQSLRKVRDEGHHFSILTDFYKAPEEIRLDPEMNRKALEAGEFIWNIHEKFRDDKEFIKSVAVDYFKNKRNYHSKLYKWLSARLKEDEELLYFLIENGERIEDIKFLPKKFSENKQVIMKILEHENLYELPYSQYKYDLDVMKKYVLTYPSYVTTIPKRTLNHLVKEKEVLFELLKCRYTYKLLPLKYKEDINVIKETLNHNPDILRNIPESIMNKELIMNLLENNKHLSLSDMPYNYLSDLEIVTKFVSINGIQLQYLRNHSNGKNVSLLLLAAKTYPDIAVVSKEMRANKEVALAFVKGSAENYRDLPEETRSDMEIAKVAIEKSCHLYQYASQNIKKDFDLAFYVIKQNPAMYVYIPSEFKLNWEFIYESYAKSKKWRGEYVENADSLPDEIKEEIKQASKEGPPLDYVEAKRLSAYLERTLNKSYIQPKKNKI